MPEDAAGDPETAYDEDFFKGVAEGSLRSAQAMLPIVLDWVRPTSLVDVGCGQGAWLSVARAWGCHDVLGLDGDYVDPDHLLIPRDAYEARDLTQPLRLDRRFDLVMSLEVAEHLPPESAEGFVDALTSLGDVVLFSAAIPGQGGTAHLNEQWQSYWAEQFARHDYLVIDALRQRFWNDESVELWYAQNTLLYVRRDRLEQSPALHAIHKAGHTGPLDIAHPKKLIEKQAWIDHVHGELDAANARAYWLGQPRNWPLRTLLWALPEAAYHGLARTLRRRR